MGVENFKKFTCEVCGCSLLISQEELEEQDYKKHRIPKGWVGIDLEMCDRAKDDFVLCSIECAQKFIKIFQKEGKFASAGV